MDTEIDPWVWANMNCTAINTGMHSHPYTDMCSLWTRTQKQDYQVKWEVYEQFENLQTVSAI